MINRNIQESNYLEAIVNFKSSRIIELVKNN